MKKTQILNISNLILFVLLIISLFIIKVLFESYFDKAWYMVVIFIYSISLYIKFCLFRSDNVLWFALVLTGIFTFMVAYNFFDISLRQWPLLAQIPCVASCILFYIYKNHLHLYLYVMLNIIVGPLFLISNNIGNIWIFIIAEIIAVFLAILVVNLINRKLRKE